MNEDGAVEILGNEGFFVSAEIVAKFGGVAIFLEDGDGVFITDARERRLNVFERLDVAFESFEFAGLVFQDGLHHGADKTFAESHDFVEFDIGGFGLKHPEFGEVAAGFGFLGAKGGAEGVDLAEGHGDGLGIELSGSESDRLFDRRCN